MKSQRAEDRYRAWLDAGGKSDSKHTNPKDILGSGRVPLELVPMTGIIAEAMAFLEGALKYGRYNWRVAGVRASIYIAACFRHLFAYWNGEDIDPDSGKPHLWKAKACLAVLIDADEVGKLTDDRPPAAPVADMLNRLKADVDAMIEKYGDRRPYQYTIADSIDADADEPADAGTTHAAISAARIEPAAIVAADRDPIAFRLRDSARAATFPRVPLDIADRVNADAPQTRTVWTEDGPVKVAVPRVKPSLSERRQREVI